MTNLTPEQEQFVEYKTKARAETLGVIEDLWNKGIITQEEFVRRKNKELLQYVSAVSRYANYHKISLPITLPQSPLDLNQEEILIIAMNNRLLYPWINHWEHKQISWEQATYGIIFTLMHEANSWRDHYIELIEKHPMGLWLQPNDYTVIIKKDEWKKSMSVNPTHLNKTPPSPPDQAIK